MVEVGGVRLQRGVGLGDFTLGLARLGGQGADGLVRVAGGGLDLAHGPGVVGCGLVRSLVGRLGAVQGLGVALLGACDLGGVA